LHKEKKSKTGLGREAGSPITEKEKAGETGNPRCRGSPVIGKNLCKRKKAKARKDRGIPAATTAREPRGFTGVPKKARIRKKNNSTEGLRQFQEMGKSINGDLSGRTRSQKGRGKNPGGPFN